jgi:hypothetical protein
LLPFLRVPATRRERSGKVLVELEAAFFVSFLGVSPEFRVVVESGDREPSRLGQTPEAATSTLYA